MQVVKIIPNRVDEIYIILLSLLHSFNDKQHKFIIYIDNSKLLDLDFYVTYS